MLKRYQVIGLLSTLSLFCFSSSTLADERIHQSVSGSTRAAGENTTAMSHTEQTAYQLGEFYGSDQQIWQEITADTVAGGQGASAFTEITQEASQEGFGIDDGGTAAGADTQVYYGF